MALLNFHLVNWRTVGQLIQPWGLGIQVWCVLAKPCLSNGCGVLLLKGGNLL